MTKRYARATVTFKNGKDIFTTEFSDNRYFEDEKPIVTTSLKDRFINWFIGYLRCPWYLWVALILNVVVLIALIVNLCVR